MNAINLDTKRSVPTNINIESTIINDQKQIADAFNIHFSTVAQRLLNSDVNPPSSNPNLSPPQATYWK